MNDDTNQRAREVIREVTGRKWFLFENDPQADRYADRVSADEAIAAMIAFATSAREEALREAAEVFGPVFQYLRQVHRTSVDAPGHMHDAPGIWDDGNGVKSGTACEWCATWNRAVDYLSLIQRETPHD